MTVESNPKTAAETTGLIPQAHGGALRPGGKPGNKGGLGRPRSELRERLCGSLAERVPVLEEIADRSREVNVRCKKCGHSFDIRPPASDGDRIRAIDTLAKYGLGTVSEVTVDQVQDRLRETIRIIGERLPDEQARSILGELKNVWSE